MIVLVPPCIKWKVTLQPPQMEATHFLNIQMWHLVLNVPHCLSDLLFLQSKA